jgi:hypothetical protein
VAGCSSSSPVDTPVAPDEAACNQAASEVSAALVGNEFCTVDSDCTVLTPPSCTPATLFSSEDVNQVPVATTSLAALEHTFSIIEAEVCPQCAIDSSEAPSGGNIPIAACGSSNLCVVTTGPPPGVGSFEWDCPSGCGSQGYCEVEAASVACQGWPGYWTVVAPGLCVNSEPTPAGSRCHPGDDAFCGFQETCQADGCEPGCPVPQPASCEGDCQLQSDNHGCQICACDSDAGCPDGGS